MRISEAESIIKSIHYQDWEFYLDECYDRYKLTIFAWVPDADVAFQTGELKAPRICTKSVVMLAPLEHLDENLLTYIIWTAVQERVLHEAKEWFVIGGERPYYPHKAKESELQP